MMSGEVWWKFHQVAYMSATPATQTPAQLASLAGNQSPLLVSRANSGYNFDWYDAVLKSGMTENNYLNISMQFYFRTDFFIHQVFCSHQPSLGIAM